ncbi:MAG: hypothetical protein EBU08_01190 [Micrococcales bacterium]|jgi:hypothetical protein|nr:hypothetical protein [Micrococcales bacterium]
MDYNASNTNRHKLMAMGKPIKAAKGGEMKKSATKASAGAKADRQGRALLPGKMAKNLPMIAPQSAYKKGGDVKPSAYDKMQDKKLAAHASKPAKVAHKKMGGMAKRSCK